MSPGEEADLVEVELAFLSYSPVAAKRADPGDFWAETMPRADLPDAVVKRFENYARRAVLDKPNEFEEVAFADENGKRFEKRMKAALKLRPDDMEARKEAIQLLANDLSGEMASAPNTLGGALFVVEARVAGKRAVTVIKLDLNPREVMALRSERRHAFEHKVFDRALPDNAKELRKAIHYPSPGEGDARMVQYDSPSEYFRRFVGARPLREAKRVTQAIVAVAKHLADEQGVELTDTQVVEMVERIQEEAKTEDEAAAIIKEVGAIDKRKATIADAVKEKANGARLSAFASLKAFRYKFRSGVELTVPSELVKDGTFTVEKKNEDVIIRIKQASIEFSEIYAER